MSTNFEIYLDMVVKDTQEIEDNVKRFRKYRSKDNQKRAINSIDILRKDLTPLRTTINNIYLKDK